MTEEPIKLSDPRTLRGYAHPLRMSLLGLLRGQNADILDSIRKSNDLDDATAGKLKAAVDGYAKSFA